MYSIDLNQDVVSCTCFVINVMNIFTVISVGSIPEWWYPTDTGGSFCVFAVAIVSNTISTSYVYRTVHHLDT